MGETRGRHSRPEPSSPRITPPSWPRPADGFPQAADQPPTLVDQLHAHWDPAEELAHLLHEAMENERSAAPPAEIHDPPDTAEQPATEGAGAPLAGLTQITAELPPLRTAPSRRRRAPARRKRAVGALQTTSFFLAALAAVVVSMVCVFGGMVAYDPLRHLAKHRTSGATVRWWPLLVYGPWMVASLSVLRAALHQRRAAHSWAVVLLFSTVSMILCVAQAPHTVVDAAAAALPSLAALACFQQLVRQITLTRPPRQANPRHRSRDRPPSRQHPTRHHRASS
ncbi:hypothetical protein BGM19_33695 [Streptomyces agglomeratus]|uniref:DUF2637 domain-containing protein n=1 Tax=Streptomyces agglomeratus TaxID=285458 RepID=UPI00086CB13B|nr:DUF2637 domain-containing protein [Streptomyces agglomeratus]OEJ62237.1 hypothetical protein BGM19_33695 [Streptomyces agglomeratus]